MIRNKMHSLVGLLTAASLVVGAAACAKAPAQPTQTGSSPSIPSDWYQLPEDSPQALTSGLRLGSRERFSEPSLQATRSFEQTVDANLDALEQLEAEKGQSLISPPGLNPPEVPWHLTDFITDLTVGVNGVLGAISTLKGSPSVTLIFARKEPAVQKPRSELGATADVALSSDTPPAELNAQLDDAARAAMATGQIRDGARLRSELGRAAAEFGELATALDSNPGLNWWPSRLRIDLVVSASGAVAPVFTSLGTAVRIRLEWHRAMPQHAPKASVAAASTPADPRKQEMQRSFGELVNIVASDLSRVSAQQPLYHGIVPYLFRVGIGMTVGGTIGVAKTSSQVIGQIYFADGVPEAPRNAPAPKLPSLSASDDAPVALIEKRPSDAHLAFAAANGVETLRAPGDWEQVVYKVNRKAFRQGLARADRMAAFFARHAVRGGKTPVGHWGLIELRSGFDMSVGGKLGLVTATGLVTSEIDLYNEEF